MKVKSLDHRHQSLPNGNTSLCVEHDGFQQKTHEPVLSNKFWKSTSSPFWGCTESKLVDSTQLEKYATAKFDHFPEGEKSTYLKPASRSGSFLVTYRWWFRNPVNSPVEVGHLSIIYDTVPTHPNGGWKWDFFTSSVANLHSCFYYPSLRHGHQ